MNKKKYFYRHTFIINDDVFRPRFESEQLVDLTYKYIQAWFKKSDRILEIGVGSGVISLSLKNLLPEWQVDAVDINEKALENTKKNQKELQIAINCWKSNLFSHVKTKYSVIIANLPYVKTNEKVEKEVLENDPYDALFGGITGLKYIEMMLKQVKQFLKNHYLIALEIGNQQKNAVIELAQKYLPEAYVLAKKDYNQLDRFIFIYYDFKKQSSNHSKT